MEKDLTKEPTVSVLLPVFNAAGFLRQAVDSILAQTFADFELIIVDDGSVDGSGTIVRSYTDERIRYVKHDRNRGLVAALNTGLDKARGKFIARMDADDVMHTDRLEVQVRYLEVDPGIAVVTAFVDMINTDGEVTGVWNTDRTTVTEAEIRTMMPRTNCIAHPTAMIRTAALGSMRYDPRMEEGEDWELWLRMLAKGLRIAKIPEVLLFYRQHKNSFTGTAKAGKPLERRLLTMRRRYLFGEWGRFRFRIFHLAVLKAQARTLARHFVSNVAIPLLRSTYRLFTYSPFHLLLERRALLRVLPSWNGRQVFLFPYMNVGGAEQVHAGIVESVAEQDPLIIFCGFSNDRGFQGRFQRSGTVMDIPRLLNHPWTRRWAQRRIAERINTLEKVTVLGSLTYCFFDLLPYLDDRTRIFYLLHAFLYQPSGNVLHKGWLRHFDRIDAYLFPSGMALREFDKFLFHNHVPASRANKLLMVPAAAPVFGTVTDHERTGILFVGRDSEEKRLPLFLRITQELATRYPGRFHFTVVGSGTQGGHSQVQFKGIIHDPVELSAVYNENDIFVLTSTREGHCLVVTEAMAHGLVVLSTPVGDIPERADPAWAVLTSSIEAEIVLNEVTRSIIDLDEDRDRMRRMKVLALASGKERFDPAEFRRVYRSLLTSPDASM